jgi:N-acyl homoserine lactone hydrolase
MQIDRTSVDIIVSGYPGKAVCHGGLGWSTIALVRSAALVGLVDVGTFGQRALLQKGLHDRGLTPASVTDVLLTHAHHDHAINWVLFKHARIVIGAEELAWSLHEPWGETPVPELYMRELDRWPTLSTAKAGDEVFPGITAVLAPGHTPGGFIYVLKGRDRDVIFTGDSAKNRAELLSRTADMTYDAAVTRDTLEMIWTLWRQRPGTVLVPGHDLPMVLANGAPMYLGQRDAAITAWFGDDLEQTTRFDLTGI